MGLNFTRSLTALAIAALPLAGLTTTFAVVGADAVYAGNGNGNGGGKGNGGGNRGGRSADRDDRGSENRGSDDRGNGQGQGGGRSAEARGQGNGNSQGGDHSAEDHGRGNGRGAVASELKGLNACHASDQARISADPESQVGRIAPFATAVEQTEVARGEWEAAEAAHEDFVANSGYTGRASGDIQADIDELTSSVELDEAELAALGEELTAAETYESELEALAADAEAKRLAYEAATEPTETARGEWEAAVVAYDDFVATSGYTGRASGDIQADIDELRSSVELDEAELATLGEELTAAETYESQLDELGADAEGKRLAYEAATAEEQTALNTVTGGRELSAEATEALRSCVQG